MSLDPDRGELRFDGRMTDLEALMWRLGEHGPVFLPAITLVVILDRVVDPKAVRDRVDLVTRRIPRLRDRVVAGPLKMVPPRWEADLEFDLGNHVQRVSAVAPGGLADLMRQAQSVASQPFSEGRPPWKMIVVQGLAVGGDALVLRLHHAYTDGLGAVKLVGELFDFERGPELTGPGHGDHDDVREFREPRESSHPAPSRSSGLGRVWADVGVEVERSAGLVKRTLPWAVGALRDAALQPEALSESVLDLVRSAREQIWPATRAGSPIMTGRSAGTHFAALDLPLTGMLEAGRRAGGTVNDVFLAGLLGGLADYHEKHGRCPASLRVGIPISTRGDPSSTDMRNQLQGAVIRGPLRPADPIERIRLVHELVRGARNQPLLGLVEDLAGLGLRLPGLPGVVGRAIRSLDLLASNVPGPPADLFMAGARVVRMVPFGPRSGAALNATLLSYGDSVDIGLNADPVAVADPAVLVDCLRSGFDGVLA